MSIQEVLILLLVALLVVSTFRKLQISPVLGYFVAGSLVGVHVFNIVAINSVEPIAEFGVVFLLFAIGLEMTFNRLRTMRLHVFGFGTLQVIISAVIIGGIIHMLGYGIKIAVIGGGGLAMSSTAVVLQVIAETRTQSTQIGRLSLAALILQDFAVVPLLVLIPLLAHSETTSILPAVGMSFLKALLALMVIFVVGRLFMRPLFSVIISSNFAKTNELFVAATLLMALGAAWTTEELGLSLALGAFAAGILVAETEYQHQAEESIMPFKGLLLGLFFMTVGMGIDIRYIIDNLVAVLSYSFGLIAIKAIVIAGLCRLFGFSLGSSIHAGLLLSQGGEFAFILFKLAFENNMISANLAQIFLSVVTITMAITPLLSRLGEFIADKLEPKEYSQNRLAKEVADLDAHVIIAGFGRVGRMVARLLEAERVSYIAVDIEQQTVEEGHAEGFPVYLGDGSNMEMLRTLGINRAACIISTVDNEVTMKKALRAIHMEFPHLPVIVRAQDLTRVKQLQEIGVTIVVPETYEIGLQLGGAVLKTVGISEFEVSRIKNHFRAGNYVLAKNIDDKFMEEDVIDEIS